MFRKDKKQNNDKAECVQEPAIQELAQDFQEDNSQELVSSAEHEVAHIEATDSANRGSFVIKESKAKAESVVKPLAFEELIEIYPFIENAKAKKRIDSPFLVLSDEAVNGIKTHISWGKQTRDNVCEQGGILIGKPYSVNEQIIGVVECVIPADATHSSGAYLEMGTDTWVKMLDTYDDLYKDKGLFVVGWFHTHPNMLSVFMSGTDMGTQRTFFNQPWHFAIVLNPHKRLIACFHSEKATPCKHYPNNFTR